MELNATLQTIALLLAFTFTSAARAERIDVWFDVDTATTVADVDDGVMLIQAFRSPELRIRGVSVQYGNAPLERAVPIAEHIVQRYGPPGLGVFAGAASAEDLGRTTPAVEAMAAALRERPMHILAVGPVTNVATLVDAHPELRERIVSIVMVAGRRPGQRFELAPRQPRPFRDFNFEHDVPAMQAVIDSGVDLVFAPWEVTRSTWLRPDDLAELRLSGGSGAWLEHTSRYWVKSWQENLGLKGFTPFDTLAVAWLTHPQWVESFPGRVAIDVGPDDGAVVMGGRSPGDPKPYLHIRPLEPGDSADRSVIYTHAIDDAFHPVLMDRLRGRGGEPGAPTEPLYGGGERSFDHARFDAVLKNVVDERGLVNYDALAADPFELDAYLEELAAAELTALRNPERLALLINAYNAFTLRLMLDHPSVNSILEIPATERWLASRWNLGGTLLSLDDIEHREIRSMFDDPRIHFALVCAGRDCPPLRAEAFVGDRLDEQLEDQTRTVLTQEPWVRHRPETNEVFLTPILKWFGSDFVAAGTSVLTVVARHQPAVARALVNDRAPALVWAEYDWSRNASP